MAKTTSFSIIASVTLLDRSVNSRAANSEVANAADFSDSSPEWLDTREFLGVYVSSF
jgi:hypothetical protein